MANQTLTQKGCAGFGGCPLATEHWDQFAQYYTDLLREEAVFDPKRYDSMQRSTQILQKSGIRSTSGPAGPLGGATRAARRTSATKPSVAIMKSMREMYGMGTLDTAAISDEILAGTSPVDSVDMVVTGSEAESAAEDEGDGAVHLEKFWTKFELAHGAPEEAGFQPPCWVSIQIQIQICMN